jgi:DnaJ-domain-containing protein 1
MDTLFERFERILKSYFQRGFLRDGFYNNEGRSGGFSGFSDRWNRLADEEDFMDAFDELDEFLRTGRGEKIGSRDFFGYTNRNSRSSTETESLPPEMLREDYRELGVAFGAPFEEVRHAYRELMRTHHPDRHGSDATEQKQATQKAQRLNTAFHRIQTWEESKHPE